MKKLILFAAILFAGFSVAKAQDPINTTATTGEVTLQVKIRQHMKISVDNTQNVVIDFATVDDYDGRAVSTPVQNHLNVFSTVPFTVNAQSTSENLTNSNGEIISGSDIQITSASGDTRGLTTTEGASFLTVDGLTTSAEGKPLFKGSHARNHNVNVTYTHKGADESWTNIPVAGVYETQVTYTIVAQ